jgi:hypothetical protein
MKNLTLIIIALLLSMCDSGKQISQSSNMNAPLIIYKTIKDYSNNIPIILNETKDKIISYPATSDIYLNGKLAKPSDLANGFLLDNFGLSQNSVFTSYTFEEYSQLVKVPTIQEFMDRIIDSDPFSEMYNCGKRRDFKTIDDINNLIKNKLDKDMKIK